MPEDMNKQEREQPSQKEAQPTIKSLLPDYKIPQSLEEVRQWQEKLAELAKSRQEAGNPLKAENLQVAESELGWQRGELGVALPYFGGIKDDVKQVMNGFRSKVGDRERAGLRMGFVFKGKKISEEQAHLEAVKEVLYQRAEVLEKVAQAIDEKRKSDQGLSAEDLGREYAANLLLNYGHAVEVGLQTNAVEKISQSIRELNGKGDVVEGLESESAQKVLAEQKKWLSEPAQLKALAQNKDVVQGLLEKETTYLGGQLAKAAKQVVEKITGREISVERLTAEKGLDLEKEAGQRAERIVTARAERILSTSYQEEKISCDEFDSLVKEVEERLPGKIKREKRTNERKVDEWHFLARFRHYARETVPVLHQSALSLVNPGGNPLAEKAINYLLTPDEQIEIFDFPGVREKIAEAYQKIREGEISFGEKGWLYRITKDGDAERIGQLSLEKRLAAELCESMGVHVDLSDVDQSKEKLTERDKRIMNAWNGVYKPLHDSIRQLYLYDKRGEAGAKKLFASLLRRLAAEGLIGKAGITRQGEANYVLITPDPKRPNKYLMGDHFQMAGLSLEVFSDSEKNWKKTKRGLKGTLKGPGWWWDRLRKGVLSAGGWKEIVKGGALTSQGIWENWGKIDDVFAYFSATDPYKEMWLEISYQEADKNEVNRLKYLVNSTGTLKKDALFEAVMMFSLKMTDLHDLTGLYFSRVTGQGAVKGQLEGMIALYKKNHPRASEDEEEVKNYIFQKTGIEKTEIEKEDGKIPETYDVWRNMLEEKILDLEDFRGTIYELIDQIKAGEYQFKKQASRWLANLLIKDPVNQIWLELIETAQGKNWRDFIDWLTEKRGVVRSGELVSDAELAKQVAKLQELRADGVLSDTQLERAFFRIDKLPRAESFWRRIATIDGLFHQRWGTPFTVAVMAVGEIFTLGKWRRESSGIYEWVRKWAGVNPLCGGLGAVTYGGMMAVEWWIAGAAPAVGVWSGYIVPVFLGAIVLTDISHVVDKYIIKFTRIPYQQYPFRPRKRG